MKLQLDIIEAKTKTTVNDIQNKNTTDTNKNNFAFCLYYIQCSNCNKLYIGETGRRLGDRIRDHLYDIYAKTTNLNPFYL